MRFVIGLLFSQIVDLRTVRCLLAPSRRVFRLLDANLRPRPGSTPARQHTDRPRRLSICPSAHGWPVLPPPPPGVSQAAATWQHRIASLRMFIRQPTMTSFLLPGQRTRKTTTLRSEGGLFSAHRFPRIIIRRQ